MAILPKRKLTPDEIRELFALKYEDVDMDLIRSYFAILKGKEAPRFNTFDTLTLPKGKLYNDEAIETTIGRYIINAFIFPKELLQKHGYQNQVLDADGLSGVEAKIGNLVLNDDMAPKEFAKYLDRGEWISLGTAYFLLPTMNYDISVPIPEVIKLRDQLFDKYKKEIRMGDPNIAKVIEGELLSLAKEHLKKSGNQSYDFFQSGEFNFGNNYKKSTIFAGAMEHPATKKLRVLKSNYSDGIQKDEFADLSNLTVIGGYARGVQTAESGYETKKLNNAVQTVMQGEVNDCGSTNYQELVIHPKMKSMFLYRWVLGPSGKEVMLDADNIDKYINKPVKLRSIMYCKLDQPCSKCTGELFNKMGITNIGLVSSTYTGSLLNMSMKKFHDTSVKFTKLKVQDYIVER